MIKPIILALLILQVLSGQRTVRVNYLDQYILNSPTTGKYITVKLNSVEGNDATVAIKVQLRQIQDQASPLTSSQLLVQTCTFVGKTCTTTFTAPSLNSAKKYAIRLAQSTIIHSVEAHVQYTSSSSNQGNKKPQNQGGIFLTPLGATNPGFRFLILNNGITFTTNFVISSSPAPNVSSYNFNLYSVGSSALTLVSTQSVTSGSSVSFTGLAVGAYYLSFDLTISSISATTQYPIILNFTFTEDQCPVENYLDRTTIACKACSTVTNAGTTQTHTGSCSCTTGFNWDPKTSTCSTALSGNGKPQDQKCTTGNYLNKNTNACAACSALTNVAATQTKAGACDCASGFYWKFETSSCTTCPSTGCPTGPKPDDHPQDLVCTTGNYADKASNVCKACSTITNAATSQTKAGACDCATGYKWQPKNSTCSVGTSSSNDNDSNGQTPPPPNKPAKNGRSVSNDSNKSNLRPGGK